MSVSNGDKVIVFDKANIAESIDVGDNFMGRNSVLYARNACFQIARDLDVQYFLQLDDDYTSFVYKFNSVLNYDEQAIYRLDDLFAYVLEYYKSIPALTIAPRKPVMALSIFNSQV